MNDPVQLPDPNLQQFFAALTGVNPSDTENVKLTKVTHALDTIKSLSAEQKDRIAKDLVTFLDNSYTTLPPRQDLIKTGSSSAPQGNPFLSQPSFAVALSVAVRMILALQSKIAFKEAQRGIQLAMEINTAGVAGAKMTKEITDTQAQEKLMHAVASFVTAGVSMISFADTASNMHKAELDTEAKITKQSEQVKAREQQAKDFDDLEEAYPPAAAANPAGISSNIAKKARIDATIDNTNPADLEHQQALKLARNDPNSRAALKAKIQQNLDDDQAALKNMKQTKARTIAEKERTLTQLSSLKADAYKSLTQAVSGVLTSSITYQRGVLEEIKGINDTMIQTLNKFAETTSKQHDSAIEQFNSWLSLLNTILQSTISAHKVGRN